MGTPLQHTRASRRLIFLLPFRPRRPLPPSPPERSQSQGRPQAARRAALTLASTGTLRVFGPLPGRPDQLAEFVMTATS
jgi:hypothetical protein